MLIIALINYLNLTISEGMKRIKNFGINKISGAKKAYFLYLFFSESFLIIIFAVVPAHCENFARQ
jgi:ABC-type antimicrobial peptide transport system permease subunit